VNNTCASSGGGIITFAYDGIVIDTCSFEGNTALAGAAAYIVRLPVLPWTPLLRKRHVCIINFGPRLDTGLSTTGIVAKC